MLKIESHKDTHYAVFFTHSYILLLRPKYSLQHPILKHPQPKHQRQILLSYKPTEKIAVLCILMFIFLESKL